MFKWYFFTLQKAPFRLAKWPVSEAEKHHIAPWNGLFRTTKWAISESKMYLFGLCYGVYRKAIQPKTGLIMPYLTFLYISFAKIFCQNFVKKKCKYVPWVSLKNIGIKQEKRHVKPEPDVRWWCSGCGSANLLLRDDSLRIVWRSCVQELFTDKHIMT